MKNRTWYVSILNEKGLKRLCKINLPNIYEGRILDNTSEDAEKYAKSQLLPSMILLEKPYSGEEVIKV